MSDEMIVRGEPQATVGHSGMSRDLGRYQPRSFSEVVVWADIMSKHGGFLKTLPGGQTSPMDKFEICLVVAEGDEYGLTPVQSLREISLFVDKDGRKRTIVGYKVLAARIQADPRTTLFEDETDVDHSTIRAQRRGRSVVEVTTRWDDLSQRDRTRHESHREDILFGRSVRKLGRRGFADLLMGMYVEDSGARVIDVAAVERTVGGEEAVAECEECGGNAFLRPNHTNGSVYAQCEKCGHRQSPPQAVRDAIRGKTEEFIDVEASALPEATTAGSEGREATAEELKELDATVTTEEANPPASEPGDVEGVAPKASSPAPPVDDEGERRAREVWTEEILATLKAGMAAGKPDPDHQFVLSTHGWDQKKRVSIWLAEQPIDVVERVNRDLAAVASPA